MSKMSLRLLVVTRVNEYVSVVCREEDDDGRLCRTMEKKKSKLLVSAVSFFPSLYEKKQK